MQLSRIVKEKMRLPERIIRMLGNSSRVNPKGSEQCHDRAQLCPGCRLTSCETQAQESGMNDG